MEAIPKPRKSLRKPAQHTRFRDRPRSARPSRARGGAAPGRALLAAAVLTGVLAGPGTAAQAAQAADSADGSAVSAALDVTGYDVTMDYQPDTGTLRGVTVVDATAGEALDRFTLHLNALTVRSVTVDGAAASFSRSGEKDLVIEPATAVAGGAAFRVEIAYDGTPGTGWLPTTSGGATAFMGSSSAWFPVHEDARDKAAFELAVTVPDGWSAVSVGREGPVRRDSGTSTFRWSEPDVDPAHIAVSVDRLTVERSALADGTPVVTAYAPGLRESTEPLAERLPGILDFLSERFGPYPFDTAGNVFLHVNDDAPATAPQTRPVYLGAGNEQFMTLDVVVHEQAHQWYGVSAAHRETRDMCLSECFASYATWLWDEAENGADLDARYREQVAAHLADPDFWAELYHPDRNPGINLYDKGPLALHALRAQIGEEAFDRLLRQWPQEHRGAYVDWPLFEEFAEQVSGQDLTGFFEAWFRGATVPPEEYLWPGPLDPA